MKKIYFLYFVLFHVFFILYIPLSGQTYISPKYSVDGQVNALVAKGDTLIVGGSFSNVGIYTGGGALFPDTSNNPNLNFPKIVGTIYSSTSDGSGGFYIYGNYRREYESSAAVSNRIEHILSDFSFQSGFTLLVNANKLYKILYNNGILYMAGYQINTIAGQTAGDLCAIDVNTQILQSWIPTIDSGGNIGCIAIEGNTLYVGGDFTKIGGQDRNQIAAIQLYSGNIKPWIPAINICNGYSDFQFYNNQIIIGGDFRENGYTNANHACAIVDTLTGDSVNYIFNGGNLYWAAGVNRMALSGDTLFAFSSGTFDTRVAAVNLSTGDTILWTKYFNNIASASHMVAINGSLYVGGAFFNQVYFTDSNNSNSANIERQINSIVSLDTRTGNLNSWDPFPGNGNNVIYSISTTGNNVFIGGYFNLVNYLPRSGIVMINTDAQQVLPFNIQISYPAVNALKLIDSTLYLAGSFSQINGIAYPASVVSFNVNSGQLLSWQPVNLGTASVIEADTKYVYLGGSLTEPSGGAGRTNLFAIDRQTANLATWGPNPDGSPTSLCIANGNLYTCGNFYNISGQSRYSLAVYDTATLSLSAWAPHVSYPTAITVKDSIVWVAGRFYDSVFSNNFFAGLNAKTGAIVQAPTLTAAATINSLITKGLYVIAGGKFSDSNSCSNILMYNTVTKAALPATSFCETFDNTENGVNTMTFIGNYLYFGGSFTTVDDSVNAPNIGRIIYPSDFFGSVVDSTINYYPKSGGNGGDVTINFQGELIHPGMSMKLIAPGLPDIVSVDSMTAFPAANEMLVTLNLRQQALGIYDVIIIDTNGTEYTYPKGFTIDTTIAPKLWVNITGSSVLRIGFNQVYTITFGNDGNVDAALIPLLITNSNIGTNIEIISPIYNKDSIPKLDTINYYPDSINYTIDDSVNNISFRLFCLNKICANSSGSMSLIFHLPLTSVLHSYSTLKAILGTPLPDSSDELYTTTGNRTTVDGDVNNLKYFSNCMGSLFQMALNDIDDYYYGSTYGSTINCISGIIPEYGNSYRYAIEKYLINPYYLPVIPANTQDFINSTNNQIVSDCAGNVPFPGLDEIALDLTIHIERKITNSLFNALGVGSNCYEPVKKYFLNCLIGNACDPNEKYGQGDSINGYYLNLDKPISYTISFENDPTANLNAQAITVTDSLNGSYFDYSTFAFTSIVFSDSVYTLNYPATSFTHDFDFTAQYGVIARVTGSFDTVKGFAQWQFQTIDPATNLPTTNATSGILPPDTTSPLGQGYVSFIVKPNKNIGTGDSICNFATIVFDNNPPITTTCWQNYFDLVNPVSKVDSLPPVENNQTFYVNWAGSDNLSGIKSYDIYVSVNDSTFYPWLTSQTITTDTFSGQFGNKYSFYSIATDKAGNVEAAKNYAEATTVLKVYTDTTGTKIYPNPNQGTFVIQTNAALIVSNIALYDLYGEKMAITYAQSNNIYTVSLNGNVPFGMYILKIKTNDNIIINKVIVAP